MNAYDRLGTIADWFDEGPDSDRYAALEGDADINLAGARVTIPFYLSRLVNQNLFRAEWRETLLHLENLVALATSPTGAKVVTIDGGDSVVVDLVRYTYDQAYRPERAKKSPQLRSLIAALTHPDESMHAIAKHANTTTKQVVRHSGTVYAIRLLREAGIRTAPASDDH